MEMGFRKDLILHPLIKRVFPHYLGITVVGLTPVSYLCSPRLCFKSRFLELNFL